MRYVLPYLVYPMAVHKHITNPGIYYITFTCYKWLHLIEITQAYDLVYNWFDVMVKNGNAICAFTIMQIMYM